MPVITSNQLNGAAFNAIQVYNIDGTSGMIYNFQTNSNGYYIAPNQMYNQSEGTSFVINGAVTSFLAPAATLGIDPGGVFDDGLDPMQVGTIYGFDTVTLGSSGDTGEVAGDGSGQTIAIVAAYDDPTIESDLKIFDDRYGLPSLAASGSSTGPTSPRSG